MLSPEPCGGEAEEVHERQGSFVVADCDTAHLLVSVEHPLDAVAVRLPVCFLRRHFGPLRGRLNASVWASLLRLWPMNGAGTTVLSTVCCPVISQPQIHTGLQ